MLALIVSLTALLAGLFWQGRPAPPSTDRARAQADTLARAKEALIGFAAASHLTGSARPGELPCPDLNGDGDAEAACATPASRLGLLPWRTLGLPDLRDASGERLWYAVSDNFRRGAASALNSDTPGTLLVHNPQGVPLHDPAAGTGAAAVVIGPGAPLVRPAGVSNPASLSQNRSAGGNPAAANYLDLALGVDNASGANGFIAGPVADGTGNPLVNDTVLAVGRDELMAAAERRVAREVRFCIEAHADSAANPTHRFPWPSPFSETAYRGKAGSYFGFLPSTQPDISPQATAQQTLGNLENTRAALLSAASAPEQLAAVQALQPIAAAAKEFYNLLAIASVQLRDAALQARNQAALLEPLNAGTSGMIDRALPSISNAEARSIRTADDLLLANIATLQARVDDLGLDAFPGELEQRAASFRSALANAAARQTRASFGTLATSAQTIADLLGAASTPNAALTARLADALSGATQARDAAATARATPSNPTFRQSALSAGDQATGLLAALQSVIVAQRVNVAATSVSGQAAAVNAAAAQLAAQPGETARASLAARERELNTLVAGIVTAATDVVARRDGALTALDAALNAPASTGDPGIISLAASAATEAGALAAAIAGNGDNLAKTSLASTAATHAGARAAFDSAANAGTAGSLAGAVWRINFWADVIYRQANTVRQLAIESVGSTSAYDAASAAVSGLSGSNGTISALSAYLASPTDAALQAQAGARVSSTLGDLDTLIDATRNLVPAMASGTASAFPMFWSSQLGACDFLNTANASSWWNANGWQAHVLYQIGNSLGTAPGSLTVNDAGAYRSVALAAGRALAGQSRATRVTAAYLEDRNAHASRDADANAPVPAFADRGPASDFNDRLAY